MFALALMACALDAGTAQADTLVVDQTAGPYTTIGAALADAADGDTVDVHAGRYDEQVEVDGIAVTLHGEPGTTITSAAAPDVVALSGDGDRLDGVTVAGASGGVRTTGDNVTIDDATIAAEDAALQIQGMGNVYVHRTLIRALAPTGTAVVSRNDIRASVRSDGAVQHAQFQADVVLGGVSGTAFDVRSGRAGEAGARGGIDLGLVTSTVTGAPVALTSGGDGQGGPVRVGALRSIVHGSAPALLSYSSETTASDAADFLAPQALDFHLRADAPAAMAATPVSWDATTNDLFAVNVGTDFAGTPLSAGNTPAVGAYVFTDNAPSASFTTSVPPGQVAGGRPVTFDASASADPDAATGGRIVKYVWGFGDTGQPPVTTTTPVITHTYADIGWEPTVYLTTYDNNGLSARASVRLHVSDVTPPLVTFSRPLDKGRLHRFRTTGSGHGKHRTITVLRFSGKGGDFGSGHPVMLTFRRTAPKVKATRKGKAAPCVYVSSGGRMVVRDCARPAPSFPVQTKGGGAWGWASAKRVAFPAGTWTLTATATDRSGNTGTAVLHFTVA